MLRFQTTGFGFFDHTRRVGPSCWDRFDLLWVRDGLLAIRFDGKHPERLPAGCGVLIYPHTPFEGDSLAKRSSVAVQHFSIDSRAGSATLPAPLRRIRRRRRGYEAYRAQPFDPIQHDLERLMEWHFDEQTPTVHAMREAAVVLILGQLEHRVSDTLDPSPRHDAVRSVQQWLATQVHRDVTLDEMAARAEMSASHFRALFRRHTGVAPGRFFQRQRMNDAARLLRESREPIKRIAQRMGYSELANFYRAFRAVHGRPPAAYRRAHTLRG